MPLRWPREPNSGESIRGADQRLLLRNLRIIEPQSSSTIRVQKSGSGSTFHLINQQSKAVAATPVALTPYLGVDASDTLGGKVTVRYGTHNNLAPTIDGAALNPPFGTPIPKLALGNGDTSVYVEFDFAFDTTGTITSYSGNSVKSASGLVPASNLNFSDDGSGTGSFYQTLFAVRVTPPSVGGGSYFVTISQAVFAIQTFQICGTGLSYTVS
jgi:hypothetical protein